MFIDESVTITFDPTNKSEVEECNRALKRYLNENYEISNTAKLSPNTVIIKLSCMVNLKYGNNVDSDFINKLFGLG